MVQLPATAAIEYVAACWVIFVRGCFCPGGSFARGTFVRGAYSPQIQCVYAPSSTILYAAALNGGANTKVDHRK